MMFVVAYHETKSIAQWTGLCSVQSQQEGHREITVSGLVIYLPDEHSRVKYL